MSPPIALDYYGQQTWTALEDSKLVGGRLPKIARACPVEDDRLVRGVDRGQQLEVEPDLADILATKFLFLVVLHVHLVAFPQPTESVAPGGHLRDQRGAGRIVVDERADGSADSTDKEPRERLPVRPCLLCARIQDNMRRMLSEIATRSNISSASWLRASTSLRWFTM